MITNIHARIVLTCVSTGLLLLLSSCNTYYLQKATVRVNRKLPTITTSTQSNQAFEMAVTGGYAEPRIAEGILGSYLDTGIAATADIDPEQEPEREQGDDTDVEPKEPLPDHNTALNVTQWNLNVQLTGTPFLKTTDNHVYRLRVASEIQIGYLENDFYLNYKIGPAFSSIGETGAVHPKILFGFSRIVAEYDALWRSQSAYSSSRLHSDSGACDAYRFYTEFGATFEFRLTGRFSLFTDVSGTLQYLFDYGAGDYTYLRYAEFSPGLKVDLADFSRIISGVSIPYNQEMSVQMPKQVFLKLQTSFGPSWGGS